MTKPNPYFWPPSVEITFRNGRGKVYFSTNDRKLDLADSLMLSHPNNTRTVYMGMKTTSTKWTCWSEECIAAMEKKIRYSICFDGYRLTLWRQDAPSEKLPCTTEFRWKLLIRPA